MEVLQDLPNVFLSAIPVVALLMEALRSWVDKEDKLKDYRLYIAIAASGILSIFFTFLAGWDWVNFVLQGMVIYGGQHIVQQGWFKKAWPIIKMIFKILNEKWKKS